jgi:hypothetical protein
MDFSLTVMNVSDGLKVTRFSFPDTELEFKVIGSALRGFCTKHQYYVSENQITFRRILNENFRNIVQKKSSVPKNAQKVTTNYFKSVFAEKLAFLHKILLVYAKNGSKHFCEKFCKNRRK